MLEEYPGANCEFMAENGIRLFQFGVAGNKVRAGARLPWPSPLAACSPSLQEPFVDIPEEQIIQALLAILGAHRCPLSCARRGRAHTARVCRCEQPAPVHPLQQGQGVCAGAAWCSVVQRGAAAHATGVQHRTGSLVGCLRKVQRWGMTSIFSEYTRFAHPKPRFMDQQVRQSGAKHARTHARTCVRALACALAPERRR